MFGKNFLIVNILILVLSITPVSAFEISKINGNNNLNNTADTDSLISTINNDEKEFQRSINNLNTSSNDISEVFSYIKSNWYKFWKWGSILNKISQVDSETNQIVSMASELNVTASRMKENAEEIEKNSKQDDLYQDPNDLEDANQMITKLNSKLNIEISTDNSNNLTEGDIIQYKSQNKYYHYLKYVKTENNNVILMGSKNKIINLPQDEFNNGKSIKLYTNTSFNSSKIINEAYKIQNDQIKDQIKDTKSKHNTYKSLAISGTVVGGSGAIAIIVGGVLTLIAIFAGSFLGKASIALFFGGMSVIGAGLLVLGIGGTLLIIGLSLLSEADKKLEKLYDMLIDLEYYNDGMNHAPIAENINLTTNGTSLNGTFNATDLDDDQINYTVIKKPLHGTLLQTADGNFSYTANNDSNGTDSFTYVANDGQLNSNKATVTLNTHVPPTAHNMNLTTRIGKNISSMFNVTDIYTSELNYTVLSNPLHGTINTSNGSFVYLPYSNYTGNDSFTYNVNDGFFNRTATVNIVVNPHNPPLANNMIVTTKKGKSVTRTFNITGTDGDRITIKLIQGPSHGKLTIKEGKFIYTPTSNFEGADFFTYTGNDGFLNSNIAMIVIEVGN